MMTFVARRLGLAALLLCVAGAALRGQAGSTLETATRADPLRADSLRTDSTRATAGASASIHDSAVADSTRRSSEQPTATRVNELIRAGDAAMARLEPEPTLQAYQAAVASDPSNYEALWKSGRTLIALGELEQRGNIQKDEYNKALKYAERAVKVNPSGAEGHFVRAYALDRVALFEGGRTRIRLAREVRVEAQRAIDLNPLLDEAYHLLGEWNYQLADLGFVSRLITKTLLGGMPDDVSFENAAHYFQLAIQANPARLEHHLEYARTLIRLNRKDEARAELQKALQLSDKDLGDPDRKEEAQQLLERLS